MSKRLRNLLVNQDILDNQNKWFGLDGKFALFLVFAPILLFGIQRIIFGVKTPLIKSVDLAQKLIPKLADDVAFVSTHYTVDQANEFALFYVNYALQVVLIAFVAVLFRLIKYRDRPYEYIKVDAKLEYQIVFIPLGMIAVIMYMDSFFTEPNEYSAYGFRPGAKALGTSMLFFSGLSLSLYYPPVRVVTKLIHSRKSNNTLNDSQR